MANTTIQLGQTVYGADINWDTGVMTVKTAFKQYNGDASEEWSYNSVYGFMMVTPPTDADNIKENGIYAISNAYKRMETPSVTTMADGEFFINSSALSSRTRYGAFKNTAFTDVTAWKAYLANNPLQIEYELANKPTIQLTPEQLELLKGYNRVTIDNGTITLDYVAKAISGNDEEIAPLVGDKATKSYAVNDFIERNDGLYRVTAPIASGASFTANNTVKMSIGEALTYLYNK